MNALIAPALVLMLLTMMVLLLWLIRRMREISTHRLAPEALSTPEQLNEHLSAKTQAPSHCLRNLTELPVIFYALVVMIVVSDRVDALYVGLAWSFVVFRAIQAGIHCTYNRVQHRFYAFMASSLVLWAMLIRLVVSVI